MLPNFLIVGAPKSGTTSMYEYLRTHPDIFMASPKELNFFSHDHRWNWGLPWYERHFRDAAGARAVGEASPLYTAVDRREVALERIGSVLPEVRLVFMARHPIARARSTFVHLAAEGLERRPIDQALVEGSFYVEQGKYWETVSALLTLAGRERLHVLRSDRLRQDPGSTLAGVHRFLGVAPMGTPLLGEEFNRAADRPRVKRRAVQKISETRPVVRLGEVLPERTKAVLHRFTRREPLSVEAELDADDAARLIDYLRDDIRAFGEFLGEDLSAWETWPPPSEATGAGSASR